MKFTLDQFVISVFMEKFLLLIQSFIMYFSHEHYYRHKKKLEITVVVIPLVFYSLTSLCIRSWALQPANTKFGTTVYYFSNTQMYYIMIPLLQTCRRIYTQSIIIILNLYWQGPHCFYKTEYGLYTKNGKNHSTATS